MQPPGTLGSALAMKKFLSLPFLLLASILFGATQPNQPPKEAEGAIDPAGLLEHIKILSSDQFEGRAPGSKGEEESVRYITAQFQKLGLKPGNPNGTYTQEVPMAGVLTAPTASIKVGEKKIELHAPEEFVAFTQQLVPSIEVKNSDLVFVGYGVVAPEYG